MATRNERREHAREVAREQRAAESKRKRRNRWLINGGIGAGLLAIVAVIALVVTTGVAGAAAPANTADDAVRVTASGVSTTPADEVPAPGRSTDDPETVDIVVFADYLCPFCGQFETANAAQIDDWVAAGAATLEFHPVAFLDRLSMGTAYSTRAANAMACVVESEPESFTAFNESLFAEQPAEGSEGLTDARLTELAQQAGAGDVSACIDGQEHAGWVADATERAGDGATTPEGVDPAEITSTPTVLVDGHEYTAWLQQQGRQLTDPEAFAEFVAEVGDVPVA